jgi:hypothetical protein
MQTFSRATPEHNKLKNQIAMAHSNKMIAENIFNDLRAYGLIDKDIVAVSSEILNKLTDDLKMRYKTNDSESLTS